MIVFQMSLDDKLAQLQEKEVYVRLDKLRLKTAYQVTFLETRKSSYKATDNTLVAWVKLADKVKGYLYLPPRYVNHPTKRLNPVDVEEINTHSTNDSKRFYVVRNGTHAGTPDVDLLCAAPDVPPPHPLYDGNYPFISQEVMFWKKE